MQGRERPIPDPFSRLRSNYAIARVTGSDPSEAFNKSFSDGPTAEVVESEGLLLDGIPFKKVVIANCHEHEKEVDIYSHNGSRGTKIVTMRDYHPLTPFEQEAAAVFTDLLNRDRKDPDQLEAIPIYATLQGERVVHSVIIRSERVSASRLGTVIKDGTSKERSSTKPSGLRDLLARI